MAVTITFTEMGDIEEGDNLTYVYPDESDMVCDETSQQTIHAMLQTVLYSLILLVGVAGNGLMITVLLRRWHLLRITELYLLHLALADLMLLFTFPFDMAENATGWLFGEFLCKLTGLMKHLNLLCGSFLLACIGFDRFLAIVHAITSMRIRRRRTVHCICILLWLVCLALSLPNAVFLVVTEEDTNTTMCFFDNNYGIHSNNWVLTMRVLDHVCFFFPLAFMSYCYTAVVITLFKMKKSPSKHGAIRLALVVTLVFCCCWLPYNVILLIQTMTDLQVITYENCDLYLLLKPALTVSKSLGYSHCCLNPFLYAFVGVRFRNELLRLLVKLGCGRVCMRFIRVQSHSQPSVSERTTTSSTHI